MHAHHLFSVTKQISLCPVKIVGRRHLEYPGSCHVDTTGIKGPSAPSRETRFNSFRPSDTYMRRSSYHYMNQCLNIVNLTFRDKIQWKLNRNSHIFIQENAFENVVWKLAPILSRPQCIKCEKMDIWRVAHHIDCLRKGSHICFL